MALYCIISKIKPDIDRKSRFLSLTHNIDITILFVCLSVRYVPIFCRNGLTYRHIFSPNGSAIILVLSVSNIFAKFRRGHPFRER